MSMHIVEQKPENEEWIWVTGYKGTDKNMRCHDYQYELGSQFDMPEGASIIKCTSGFHLCRELDQVFRYYPIGKNNRFFEVRALVRKNDVELESEYHTRTGKLVAKSIEFVRELTPDEIFYGYSDSPRTNEFGHTARTWSDEHKRLALEIGVENVNLMICREKLLACGYSEGFVEYLIAAQMTDMALALGSQTDLSMDVKVLTMILGRQVLTGRSKRRI